MPVKKSHSIYSQPDPVFEDDIDMDVPQSLTISPPPSVVPQPSYAIHSTAAASKSPPAQQRSSPDAARSRIQTSSVPTPTPDPAIDITRLRVRAQRHHCLYPGATFQGTQKSGRNSYDVNVTIVDVDFSSSFLCGRYGFLTQKWGANEQEDMVHWQRFPAFRHVKNELRRPHLTMPDRDRGAVFMRWKERFLVPDHRVQDINGASFAGFYYVCVDFNPQSPGTNIRSVTQPFPLCAEEYGEGNLLTSPSPGKLESIPVGRRRRDSSVRRGGRGSSIGPRSPPAATMSGFYFHQNSEPYQQLSLSHVPERSSSCFEFR
ncbi:vacuolar import and degradation protein-domain-containing protein [Boletus reticuloceps]|uniref:Vacuolar import and degradation protein-domain-containing protein n=1 Tax=Boletus reticuloceps TaxID=495285 RepID=A0A8I2YQU6_9AGAM|nr:vacuolar import and degradation protein-domain-containing protein [Boletus reticuloceps]